MRYQRDIVESNGIQTHIQLNSKLVGSEWVVEKHGYILQIERSDPQGLAPIRLETAFANVIIQALGGANQFPKYPPIWESGADVFGGDMFHSARWRTDVDLAGQRIGVIGNAASATQIVPELSKDPSAHVVNFCRSPNWFATRVRAAFCLASGRLSKMELQLSSHSKCTRKPPNGSIVIYPWFIESRDSFTILK